jgi:hypothetical protein
MSDDFIKRMPLKDLVKLIECHYATVLILEAAVRDIPELPKDPYKSAYALFVTQLNTLVAQHEKRTNSTRTQRMVDKVVAACTPVNSEAATPEASAEVPTNG